MRAKNAIAYLLLAVSTTAAQWAGAKDNAIDGSVLGGDKRAETLTISIDHRGTRSSMPPCSLTNIQSPQSTFFFGDHPEDRCVGGPTPGELCTGAPGMGTCGSGGTCTTMIIDGGEQSFVEDNLCGGTQRSDWSIEGIEAVGNTTIKDDDGAGTAVLRAEATAAPPVQEETTTASATVTVSGAFQAEAGDTASSIPAEAKGDDATIGGNDRTTASATSSYVARVGGNDVMELVTSLTVAGGGFASIISGSGLTLPAAPGTSGAYTATLVHQQDPAQSFSFDVSVSNGVLAGPDAANPDWTLVGGSWFLPEASFPSGADVTWSVPAGATSEFESTATEYDERFRAGPVPVLPTWGIALLGLALLALVPLLARLGRRSPAS